MHIWYIHPYGGGPGLGAYDRPFRLARAWQRQGHSVRVFIASFHHLLERDVLSGENFDIEGVPYVPVRARPYAGNGPGRLLNMWDFCANLPRAARAETEPPDAIIVSSPHPFPIVSAHRLARRHGARLVFEIRDLWPLSITEILGTSPLHPFVQLCAMAERFALTRADLVASVLPRAGRYLEERGYGQKPFVWVPNGTGEAPAAIPAPPREETLAARARLDAWRARGRVGLVYAGSMGAPNALDLLVEALAHAQAVGEGDLCGLVLAGKGGELEALRALVDKKRLSNVHFAGPLPKSDALALLRGADIGYAGLRSIDALFGYGISPNKIADYFAAGLPVLLPIEPCGDPVSESGGGIARRAQTPQAVWEALRELVLMTPDARRAMGRRGRDYMAREYPYERIAARYIHAIEAAAPPR